MGLTSEQLDSLASLAELRDNGTLTDDEYDRERAAIMHAAATPEPDLATANEIAWKNALDAKNPRWATVLGWVIGAAVVLGFAFMLGAGQGWLDSALGNTP